MPNKNSIEEGYRMPRLGGKVLLVHGSGGHNEQMSRLMRCLNANEVRPDDIISIVDHEVKHVLTKEHMRLKKLSSKYSYVGAVINFITSVAGNFLKVRSFVLTHSPDCMISTGPGVAVLPIIYCRLKGIKIIYFESWSKFYSLSMTGKIAYRLVDHFLVQNTPLIKKYPRSIYLGRL